MEVCAAPQVCFPSGFCVSRPHPQLSSRSKPSFQEQSACLGEGDWYSPGAEGPESTRQPSSFPSLQEMSGIREWVLHPGPHIWSWMGAAWGTKQSCLGTGTGVTHDHRLCGSRHSFLLSGSRSFAFGREVHIQLEGCRCGGWMWPQSCVPLSPPDLRMCPHLEKGSLQM